MAQDNWDDNINDDIENIDNIENIDDTPQEVDEVDTDDTNTIGPNSRRGRQITIQLDEATNDTITLLAEANNVPKRVMVQRVASHYANTEGAKKTVEAYRRFREDIAGISDLNADDE